MSTASSLLRCRVPNVCTMRESMAIFVASQQCGAAEKRELVFRLWLPLFPHIFRIFFLLLFCCLQQNRLPSFCFFFVFSLLSLINWPSADASAHHQISFCHDEVLAPRCVRKINYVNGTDGLALEPTDSHV